MKRILFAVLVFCSAYVFAQKEITIDESVVPMSRGSQPSFTVVIPQTTLKDVEKDWLKYVGKGSKGKATSGNGENVQPGAINKNISSNPVTIFSRLLETSDGVHITAWFADNDSVFISKTSMYQQDLAVQKYLRDFAVDQYRDAVKKELKGEEDKLKDLQKDLEGYNKDEDKAIKKISEYNRDIDKCNSNISANNLEIQNTINKISDQKIVVDNTATDPNANKGAKQTLKDLENSKKKLQNNNDKEGRKIDNARKDIREQQRKITDLKAQEKDKSVQIEQQKQKVQAVQSKLDNIK